MFLSKDWVTMHCRYDWLIKAEAERRIYASIECTIIGSDNGLRSVRYQAIVWTNAGLLLMGIWIELQQFSLTHLGRDKMDAIFQTTFSNAFLWMKTYESRLRFHLKFVRKVPIDNNPALV